MPRSAPAGHLLGTDPLGSQTHWDLTAFSCGFLNRGPYCLFSSLAQPLPYAYGVPGLQPKVAVARPLPWDHIQRNVSTIGIRFLVVLEKILLQCGDQLRRLCKTPLRTRVTVRSRKKRSAMLSHEALVGVKWGWNRGGA